MARYMLINLFVISLCLLYVLKSGFCAPVESEVTSENGTVYKIKVYDAQRPPPPRFESLKQGKSGSDDDGDGNDGVGGDSDNDGTPKVVFQKIIYAPPPVFMSAKQSNDDSNDGITRYKNQQSNNQDVVQDVQQAPPPVIESSRIRRVRREAENLVTTDENNAETGDNNEKLQGNAGTPGSDSMSTVLPLASASQDKKYNDVTDTAAGVNAEANEPKNVTNSVPDQEPSENNVQIPSIHDISIQSTASLVDAKGSDDNVVSDNDSKGNLNPAPLNDNDKNPSTLANAVINGDPDKPTVLGSSTPVVNKLDEGDHSDDTNNGQTVTENTNSEKTLDEDEDTDSDNTGKMINTNANGDGSHGDDGGNDNEDKDDRNSAADENGSNTVKLPIDVTDVQGDSEEDDDDDLGNNSRFDDNDGDDVVNENVPSQSDSNPEEEDGIDEEAEEDKEEDDERTVNFDAGGTGEVGDKRKPVSNGDLSDQSHYEKKMMSDESGSTHFMSYFLVATVFVACFYLVFHNRQKVKAYILEGRRGGHRRKVGGSEYRQLSTAEEVLPSANKGLESKISNYAY